ncbi:hypothetical protein BCR34DRAFT_296828 [Clohesyomyces aquaticus]|uniref:Regulatory P domain-containing protein n=1 Tax=Clohesyomyces aquaticus TaxID=1231657 RepID=A0A1Y2A990_9PLEO|nr:hypothetical protein BCR34DRAFT_296828 [Clohesyomyces aquaticus]
MKFATLAVLVLASTAMAKEMVELMTVKTAQRNAQRVEGVFKKGRWNKRTKEKCRNGKAGEYGCENVDMLDFLSHEAMGSMTREGNDIWGWTSKDGREFGAVGQTDGTAFVEVKKNGDLAYLGRLPTQTETSIWRDMKVIGDHVYIGSEAPGHGLQIFDMKKLLGVKGEPKTFSIQSDLTAWFKGFGSSHNIVAHEATDMIYAVGTSKKELPACAGGLFMVDVSNPAKPTSPGCVGQDGYVHDAQCVIYSGPDAQYKGKEVCFGYNEDTLTIYDVTKKSAPVVISTTPYAGSAYTHQGWLVSTDMRYLLLDDELDEVDQTGVAANNHTTTYIFDISTLADPQNTGYYQSPVKSIDHNQYVINGLSYQANYGSGLRIVDVSSVSKDPTGKSFKQVGFFDCHPEDDAVGGVVEFVGTWSVYPYFKSGNILLNSIERGIYSLKYTAKR